MNLHIKINKKYLMMKNKNILKKSNENENGIIGGKIYNRINDKLDSSLASYNDEVTEPLKLSSLKIRNKPKNITLKF